jgi:hypothetical protein
MFSLALLAITGCGTTAYTYSGYWTADHFPLGGERNWQYQNEGEDFLMKVENISSETVDGDTVVTLNYTNETTNSLMYSIKWAADKGSAVKIHGYYLAEGVYDNEGDDTGMGTDAVVGSWVNFSPPIELTERQGSPGDVVESTDDGVNYVSTFDAYESCPNLWTQDWECMKMIIESDESSPAPFVGTWHWATEYGTSIFQPAGAEFPWRLTSYEWSPAD